MRRLQNAIAVLPDKTRNVVTTCAYGLIGGAGAVSFLLLVNLLYRSTLVALSQCSLSVFVIGSFIVIVATSVLSGFLLHRLSPKGAGSGIPEAKIAYWKDLGWIPWRNTWVKFLAGLLSIGGGASLGREGPTVFISSGCASAIAGWFGVPKQGRRTACVSGAAAGLAAAFNTPLAAITFVLEELLGELNNRVLGSVVLASVIGAFVVYGTIGRQPAFTLPFVDDPSWKLYCLTPLVAAMAAVIGGLFQKRVMAHRHGIRTRSAMPLWLRPGIGALITWVIGTAVFAVTGHLGVFSLGYDDLSAGLNLTLPWRVAAILLGAKLLATIACYSWGGCGGIFSPTLVLGGMTGLCISALAGHVTPLTSSDHVILAAVGMSACLGAVVRAPLTALLIVFEMTHAFAMVPALMLGAVVSESMARILNKHNFYDTLLLQDGHDIGKVKPPRDLTAWQGLPIATIANLKPVVLQEFSPVALQAALTHPYQRFPVEIGRDRMVVTRAELEAALSSGQPPRCELAVACTTTQTVRDVGKRIIEAPYGMVLLLDPSDGRLVGLVTLHDLLRAQVAIAE